ncbi:MAG: hypothetical protein JWM41_4595 [Gemmatimonadetes bacterium]|nr:hypothetical protein [Gemmatimonadota bacterium]
MLRSTLAAAGIALLLTSPSLAQQGRDDATFTWSKQLGADSRLTIRNGNGPISVRESSSNRVEVRAAKIVRSGGSTRDVAFDVRESNGEVEICTLYDQQQSCGDRNRGYRNTNRVRVEFTVLVPRSTRVNASTGNGDVTIERAGADVSVSTGNGKVMVGETTGRVDATSGNGDVRIESANGPVTVTTGNGRIDVTTALGAVNANTGNGDIDVRMKSLPSDAGMTFNSGSGAIRVTLPDGFNGRIDASSGNGSLRSDFDISIVGRLDAQHVRGTIGKGGPLLRLNTGNGQIELRKN